MWKVHNYYCSNVLVFHTLFHHIYLAIGSIRLVKCAGWCNRTEILKMRNSEREKWLFLLFSPTEARFSENLEYTTKPESLTYREFKYRSFSPEKDSLSRIQGQNFFTNCGFHRKIPVSEIYAQFLGKPHKAGTE